MFSSCRRLGSDVPECGMDLDARALRDARHSRLLRRACSHGRGVHSVIDPVHPDFPRILEGKYLLRG